MPGLSVTALCVPAREVGGDYYDFLPLDDHRLGVLIADVSGKGTSAALYMAELKGLCCRSARSIRRPATCSIAANRIIAEQSRRAQLHHDDLCDHRPPGADDDLCARRPHAADVLPAGDVPGRRRGRILAPDGLVLGLKIDNGRLFERLLEEQTIPLHDGDLFVLFTDGISEAMNAADDCFGDDAARPHPRGARRPAVRGAARARPARIAAFVGDAPQHDDMTMILLKVDAHDPRA